MARPTASTKSRSDSRSASVTDDAPPTPARAILTPSALRAAAIGYLLLIALGVLIFLLPGATVRGRTFVGRVVAILDPLPHVACGVVQTEAVGLEGAHGRSFRETIVAVVQWPVRMLRLH